MGVDLGRVRMPSFTVPVTIKSLVFSEDPRGPAVRANARHGHDHPHGHGHHHHHPGGHHQDGGADHTHP